MSTLQPIYDLSRGSGLSAAWAELETAVPHSRHTAWITEVSELPQEIEVTRSAAFDGDRAIYLIPGWSDPGAKKHEGPPVRPDCWALLAMRLSGAVYQVALDAVGPTPEAALEIADWLKTALPPAA